MTKRDERRANLANLAADIGEVSGAPAMIHDHKQLAADITAELEASEKDRREIVQLRRKVIALNRQLDQWVQGEITDRYFPHE